MGKKEQNGGLITDTDSAMMKFHITKPGSSISASVNLLSHAIQRMHVKEGAPGVRDVKSAGLVHSFTIAGVLLLVLISGLSPIFAQPSLNQQDYDVVRKLLDINGLTDLPVSAACRPVAIPSGEQRVGEIKLSGKRVARLPKEIGNLTWLRSLKLAACQIAELPGEIGQCTRLEELWIDKNRLTSLPPELALCAGLKLIALNDNPFESFPPEIGNIPIITALKMTEAPQGIPQGFGFLKYLKKLDLSGLQINAVPEEIGALAALEELNLANNNIGILPESFGKLSSLSKLNLSGNRLITVPASFGQLGSLKECRLENNLLKAMPDMSGMNSLEYLNLSHNALGEFPPGLVNAAAIRTLNLSRNQLRALPVRLGMLSGLEFLSAGSNQIVSIPPSIAELNKLVNLDLSHNRLSQAPGFLGRLKALKILHLDNNSLFTLPDSLTLLTALNAFHPARSSPTPDPLDLAGNQICRLEGQVAVWADSFDTDWREMQGCDTLYQPGLLPWKKLEPLPGQAAPARVQCALALGGTYLAGADDGLWRYTAEGWAKEWTPPADVYHISSIVSGKGGSVYMGLGRGNLSESGLYRRSGGGDWSPCAVPITVNALARGPDSLLVAATDKGIYRQRPDLSWVFLDKALDLDSLPVHSPMAWDVIYIQGRGFLARVGFSCQTLYCTHNYYFVSSDGQSWRVDSWPVPAYPLPDLWKEFSSAAAGPEALYALFKTKHRGITIGTQTGSLSDMALDRNGVLLAATSRGAYEMSIQGMSRCDKGLPFFGLASVGVSPEGRFYVGAADGLYVNNSWIPPSASTPFSLAQKYKEGAVGRTAMGRVHFSWPEQWDARIRIYNTDGGLVFSSGRLSPPQHMGSFEIPGKRLGKGVFYYNLACYGINGALPAPSFTGRLIVY